MTETASSVACKIFFKACFMLTVVVSAFYLAGCGNDSLQVATGDSPVALPGAGSVVVLNNSPMTPTDSGRPLDPQTHTFSVSASVMQVSVPAGAVSRTERIWRYLDEQIGLASDLATMNQNGFRVAVGPVDAWPRLSGVLRQMTGQTLESVNYVSVAGRPLELAMSEDSPARRIFCFDSSGRLSGSDYPAGDYIFMLDFRVNPDLPGGVLLHMAPQLRTKPRVHTQHSEFGLRKELSPDYYDIGDMKLTVDVPQDHFIVIGPGSASGRKTSPSREFLLTRSKGLQMEKVLVIVPRVYASELGGVSVE